MLYKCHLISPWEWFWNFTTDWVGFVTHPQLGRCMESWQSITWGFIGRKMKALYKPGVSPVFGVYSLAYVCHSCPFLIWWQRKEFMKSPCFSEIQPISHFINAWGENTHYIKTCLCASQTYWTYLILLSQECALGQHALSPAGYKLEH